MIFLLSEAIFIAPQDEALLVGLIRTGATGRHKIRTVPGFRTTSPRAVHDWLSTLTPDLRRTAILAFDNGQQAPSFRGPSEPQIEVGAFSKSCWTLNPEREPCRLTVADAHELAIRPLRLLLENARNDFGFLSKIVPQSWRARWEKALSSRWVEPSGGGIDEMRKVIEHQLTSDPMRRLASFALFDSDARSPGAPSDSAQMNSETCTRLGVIFHQLERRAIENYLPKEALYDWANRAPKKTASIRRARVSAYLAMQPASRRHHYNLKAGFRGDEKGDKSVVSPIYTSPFEGHDPVTRPSLLDEGIDKDIMQVWRESDYEVGESALVSEGFERERAFLFQSLFGRV